MGYIPLSSFKSNIGNLYFPFSWSAVPGVYPFDRSFKITSILLTFCVFLLHWFCLVFFSFLQLPLVLICSFVSTFLIWKRRSLILSISSLLTYTFKNVHVYPNTALAAFHKFYYVVFSLSLRSKYWLIFPGESSLTQNLVCSWHPAGRGQRCCSTFIMHRASPQNKQT